MTDMITVTGLVATTPRYVVAPGGITIASFRLASNQRRFDRNQNAWIDGDTNWYTVNCFRQLADNVDKSIEKGHRVLVVGRLNLRSWESEGRSGTNVEIDAEAVGHDLAWGRSEFSRGVVTQKAPTTSKTGSV